MESRGEIVKGARPHSPPRNDGARYPEWPNLAAMLFDRARTWPTRPMLRAWRAGGWQTTSWALFASQAAALARTLHAAGVAPGDRVLILSENAPEYPIAEAALMAIRAVPVPAYTTNTPADHAFLLSDAGIRAAVVGSHELGERLAAAAKLAGGLALCVTLAPGLVLPDARIISWEEATTTREGPEDVAREAAAIPSEQLACLIYTSGTGGVPKGVMLPHRAILSNCRGAEKLVRSLRLEGAAYLSFLPLSHSYEHTVGQFFLPSIGAEVVYGRGIEHLAQDLLEVRPELITVVPRILEVVRARILGRLAHASRLERWLFEATLADGLARLDGRPETLGERFFGAVSGALVRRKVRARFGGRLRAIVSGGARLDPETGRFFAALDVPLMQGYGQTEAGPVVSATPPGSPRIETVGPPLEGVGLRIADDGEILVRGELVMMGYWNRPEATAAALEGDWLHTGDIGALDRNGYLRITDRKKDIIVLSGGDNVSPARVEEMLMREPEISQAVVYGDRAPNLSALLVAAEGANAESVAAAVARVNERLAVTERVRRHTLVSPFTQENGLLTPTQKIRRRQVLAAYGAPAVAGRSAAD